MIMYLDCPVHFQNKKKIFHIHLKIIVKKILIFVALRVSEIKEANNQEYKLSKKGALKS